MDVVAGSKIRRTESRNTFGLHDMDAQRRGASQSIAQFRADELRRADIRDLIDSCQDGRLASAHDLVEPEPHTADTAIDVVWKGKAFVWDSKGWRKKAIRLDKAGFLHVASVGMYRINRFRGVCSGSTLKRNWFVALDDETVDHHVLVLVFARKADAEQLISILRERVRFFA
jgi:hypothetical protein